MLHLAVAAPAAALVGLDAIRFTSVISNYARREGVRVLLGNGDGTFQSGAGVTSTPMVWVRVADFNRDGRTDVATILIEEPAIVESRAFLLVFLGQGDGTFGPETRTELIRRALLV